MDEWLEVGRIVAPQGLNGEVRVYPDSDFPERFLTAGERWLRRSPQEQPESVQLKSGRYLEAKNLYVIKLQGVNNRNAAEALRGQHLLVKADDRPQLEPGEFYLMDLIGLTVVHHQTRQEIGTVVRIATAGNDLLEIQLNHKDQDNVLVPFVKAFFPSIDLQKQILELQPLPGLLPES